MNTLLVLTGIFATLVTLSAYGLLRLTRQNAAVAGRLEVARGHADPYAARRVLRPPPDAPRAGPRLPLRLVAAVGGGFLRINIVSPGTLAALEETLTTSGMRSANALPLFVGSKIVLMGILPAIAWFLAETILPDTSFIYTGPAIGIAAALLLPDTMIRRIRSAYVGRVEQGVADALDMMVICARAGLPLESSINRVADEIRDARPEIARELAQTAAELHVVSDVRVALENFGTRTGLESLKRLTTTLVQTIEYGTPLVDALRTLSAEMREHAMTQAEARAARLPVLLTIPMILFILPCQFIIAGGPAALQISKAF